MEYLFSNSSSLLFPQSNFNPCLTTLQPAQQPSTAASFDKHAEIDKKPCWKMPLSALFLPLFFFPLPSFSHSVSTGRVWEDRNGFLSDTAWLCHLPCQLVKEDRKGGGDKWWWPGHDCPAPLLRFHPPSFPPEVIAVQITLPQCQEAKNGFSQRYRHFLFIYLFIFLHTIMYLQAEWLCLNVTL